MPKESKTKPTNPPNDGPTSLVEDQKALAFSTLLSSQETDTTFVNPSGLSPGQPF
ncbi:hypothetical protein Airi02_106710 [Actinoallomurus iriomotensis]|uniref:Uncharacterized protein n=1 Tax=Actinoallomurus iriomotensis TaxID=478107 RepID=A0A9W6SFR4_9ACTN|nr:hypothetical protein Airi02_106710 [Actinoallomurus iriomotensis]